MKGRSIISRERGERVGMAGSSLKGAGWLQRSHCSGAAVPSGTQSANGECPTLAELCRMLPRHSWVLGTDRFPMSPKFAQVGKLHHGWQGSSHGAWQKAHSHLAGLQPCHVLGCTEPKSLLCCTTHLLVPPQSLPKSHVETRKRQTIIPHGVPFMVKLLCYYVSEDSIFLHLEHVQGETLWSHLRSKYCVQQDGADASTIQTLRDHGTEDGVGNSQGVSQVSILPVGKGSGLPGSVNYQVLGNADASLPQEQSPGNTDSGSGNRCQLLLAPAGGRGAAPGGQDLSVAQTVSGVVDHFPAASAKCPGHLGSQQGLVVYPWNDPTSGTGCISEKTASQQGPRLPQGLVPVPKTVRRGQPGAGKLPAQKVSEASQAQPLQAVGERQLPAGVALSSSGKPSVSDPAMWEPSWGASLTCGRLSKQPPSGQCRASASQGHKQRAWAVKEEQVQLWAAEILLALEGLHQQGVLCRDLNPRNLLLDTSGHVRLTFFGQWAEVEPQYCSQAREELYSAPEVGGIMEPTEAADCWSFGSLLYELLTGVPLSQNHPSGIQPHTQLHLPEGLSLAATLLLTELLQYNPKRRLGSGGGGITKLKSHSFFSTVPWNKLVG
uniref:Ribosomal protein S6 kinase like 1 n=1 Tax=Ficedula albicollis TaxID=59894 RepID=U3JV03_FICAL